MGWLEGVSGIGLIIGPILGAALYAPFGYAWTFYIYGVLMILMSIIVKLCFPKTAGSQLKGDEEGSALT